MKKYKYKIVYVPDIVSHDIVEKMIKQLNTEGDKGWKLIPCLFFTKKGQMLLEHEEED